MKQSNQSLNKISYGKPLRHIFSVSFIVTLSIFTFAMIVATFGEELSWGLAQDIKDLKQYGMSYYYSEPYIAIIGGFTVALLQFRYLHSKKHSFTMLSFPVKRQKLFLRDAFIPLGALALITVVIKAVALGINIYILKFSVELLKLFIVNVLLILLPLFFSYTVTVASMLFTGRTSEGIATSISGILLPTALFSLIDNIFNITLHGYDSIFYEDYLYFYPVFTTNYSMGTNEITRVLSEIDPTGNFYLYECYYSDLPLNETVNILTQVIKSSVWIAIFITSIILMSRYFEKRYKPEYCGVKGKSRVPLVLVSIVLPLLLTNFSFPTEQNIPDTVLFFEIFTAAIVAVIIGLILNIIVCRGVKKILCGVIGGGAILVTTILLVVIGSTGCFGYSSYLPDAEKIENITVSLPFEEILPVNADNRFFDTDPYLSETSYIKLTSENDISILQNIHSTAVESRDKDTSCRIEIIYTLKNGKTVPRCYNYISNAVVDKALELSKTDKISEFYKVVLNQHEYYNSGLTLYTEWEKYALDFSGEDTDSSDYYSYSGTYDAKSMCNARNITIVSKDNSQATFSPNNFEEGQVDSLKKALYEDLCSLSAEQLFTPEKQIGVLILSPTIYPDDNDGYYLYPNSTNQLKISITRDMKKTLSVLEEMGLTEHFNNNKEIKEAHTVNIRDAVKWYTLRSSSYLYYDIQLKNPDTYILAYHTPFYSWDNSNNSDYLYYASRYMTDSQYYNYDVPDTGVGGLDSGTYVDYYTEDYYSEFIKAPEKTDLTPEEAKRLQENAFMTYNIGDNGKFLVIKYTDGTSNMLVIPE